ncbi:MAG: HAD family phosphatase [Clostridia bacterium]|nr:HAD family phosphatase [Clostridia bacterium]
MIKLIATDLDNTLLDRKGAVPPATLRMVKKARVMGVPTAVVTGRSYASAGVIARRLGGNAPVICYNGAMILREGEEAPLYESYVPQEVVGGILAFAKERGIYVQLYDHHVIVVERLRRDAHPDPDLPFTACREAGDFSEMPPFPTPKLLLAAPAEQVPVLQAQLEARYGDRAYFAQSEPYLIEVMAKGTHKGAALERLAALMGVEKREIMACGDNTNDIPLLKAAGVSVAVANAVPQVKEIATYVCSHERSAGFREAVERFVFAPRKR